MTRIAKLAPLALVLAFGACDNEALIPPTANPNLASPMFARYVAFGNSITAGFQSGGLNDSLQERSYANLLAGSMGTEFNLPLLNRPGCPPPFTNVFTQEVVGPPLPTGCAFRNPIVPDHINNVAFPGAEVIEAYNYFDPSVIPSATDAFRSFLLGGRTPVDVARDVAPTFVTVWLGANNVLGAILSPTNPGDSSQVTLPATFAAQFAAFMDTLDSFGSIQGGVIIGVPQAVVAPYLTQGRAWKGFEVQFDALTAPLNVFDVTNACLAFQAIPNTNDTAFVSVPFAVGAPKLALAQARLDSVLAGQLSPAALQVVVLDCAQDAQAVTVSEALNMIGAVAAYNVAIEAEADARGWPFIDPNPLLRGLAAAPGQIRPFPAFLPSDPQHVTAPFGSAFSLDGIHPSSATHLLIANALIGAINAAYGTSLATVN